MKNEIKDSVDVGGFMRVKVTGEFKANKENTKVYVPVKDTCDREATFLPYLLVVEKNSKKYSFENYMENLRKVGSVVVIESCDMGEKTIGEDGMTREHLKPLRQPILAKKADEVTIHALVVDAPDKSVKGKTSFRVQNLEYEYQYFSVILESNSEIKRELLSKKGNKIEITGNVSTKYVKERDPVDGKKKKYVRLYFAPSEDPKILKKENKEVTVHVEVSGVGMDINGSVRYPVKVLDKGEINQDYIGVVPDKKKGIETDLLEKRGNRLYITGHVNLRTDDSRAILVKRIDHFELTESPKIAKIKKVANAVDKEQGVKI